MGWLVLLVLGGVAAYVMSPDERTRAARTALRLIEDVWFAFQDERAKPDPFRDALRARTRWPVVTWLIVAANVLVFIAMGAGGDAATIVRWGGNIAPQTTSGDWWRLLTAAFVHAGFIALFVDLIGLTQIALLLERLVGHLALAAVFLSGAILQALINLTAHPLAVSVGASGGVLAVYGLLAAVLLRGMLRRSPFTIPLHVLRWFAPAAAIFLLHALWVGDLTRPAGLVPLALGFVFGVVVARHVDERPARVDRVGMVAAATLVMSIALAIPLRGIVDVRPELARLVVDEDRAAHDYQAVIGQFKLGAMKPAAVAEVIERRIEPELNAAQTRLHAVGPVPREQEALVTAAGDYLALRIESWQLRAKGFHTSNMRLLRDAEVKERSALAAIDKIR